MKTKTIDQLSEELYNKGPSYIVRYFICNYKDLQTLRNNQGVITLEKIKKVAPNLRRMSFIGKKSFIKRIRVIADMAKEKENESLEKYDEWRDKHKNLVVSNEEASAICAAKNSFYFKAMEVQNDFYKNCKIQMEDRVELTEEFREFPAGFVGTAIEYGPAYTLSSRHMIKVEFELRDPETNDLLWLEQCFVPMENLKVVERWNKKQKKYSDKFNKATLIFANFEFNTQELFHNTDKEEYGYEPKSEQKNSGLRKFLEN